MRAPSAFILFSSLSVACGGDSGREIISPPAETAELLVTWRLQRDDGTPVSCVEAQVETVRVSVGGEPTEVACDSVTEPRAAFGDLPLGRYPVVIRLLGVGDAVLREHRDNVDLGAEGAAYDHTFVLGDEDGNRGELDIQWLLSGESPEVACAVFGADRVIVESQPGSTSDLQADLLCTEGRLEVANVLRGDYGLLFRLLDADRNPIPRGAVQRDFRVRPGEVTTDIISFPLLPAESATLRLEWTVNGDDPADVCIEIGGQEVRMKLFQQRPSTEDIPIRTATAACDAGLLVEPEVNASATPELLRFRVSAELRGFAGLILTSTTVADVELRRAETSTVAFDFTVDP